MSISKIGSNYLKKVKDLNTAIFKNKKKKTDISSGDPPTKKIPFLSNLFLTKKSNALDSNIIKGGKISQDFDISTVISKPISLIDKISLNGLLSAIAVFEIQKLMSKPSELFLFANKKKRLVNVFIIENENIKDTSLDFESPLNHNPQIGKFLAATELNLNTFADEDSLFNFNPPEHFLYGRNPQQIWLLANHETIQTLKKIIEQSDPNMKQLTFSIGYVYIPLNFKDSFPDYIKKTHENLNLDECLYQFKRDIAVDNNDISVKSIVDVSEMLQNALDISDIDEEKIDTLISQSADSDDSESPIV